MDKNITRYLQDIIFFVAGIIVAIIASEFFEYLFSSRAVSITADDGIFFLLAITLVLNTIFVARISFNVTESIVAMGVRVKYVEDRWVEGKFREGTVFEAVQNIIREAQEEVLISGYNDPQFDPVLTSLADIDAQQVKDTSQKSRIQYLETIEKKLERPGRKPFKYTRIIQMPDTESIELSPVTLGPIEFEHCKNALQIKRKTRNPAIHVMKMETERILTFMIVDGKVLIISDVGTRRTESGKKAEYLAGVFIIEDYNGSVINGFEDYFRGELVPIASPVELADLYDSSETAML